MIRFVLVRSVVGFIDGSYNELNNHRMYDPSVYVASDRMFNLYGQSGILSENRRFSSKNVVIVVFLLATYN